MQLATGTRLRGTASAPSIGQAALTVANSVIGMTPSKKRFTSAISRSDVTLLLDYLKDGTMSSSFCVGSQKDCSGGNYFQAVRGIAHLSTVESVKTVTATKAKDTKSKATSTTTTTTKFAAQAPKITVGTLAYLAAESVREGAGKTALQLLDSMRALPLANSNLTFAVHGSGSAVDSMTITVRGTPPSKDLACTNVLSCAIKERTDKKVSPVVQTLEFDGKKKNARVTSAYTLGKMVTAHDRVLLEDARGDGPTLFVSQHFAPQKMTRGARPVVGTELGIKVCVEHCEEKKGKNGKPIKAGASKRFAAFAGQLRAASDGLNVKGTIKMAAPWNYCFGSSFAHINDGMAKVSVSMSEKPARVSTIQLSASACFGSKAACVDGSSAHFFKGEAVGRLDPNDAAKDFVALMFADATVDKVFTVLADSVSPRYEVFRQKLPDLVRASGVFAGTNDERCKK